MTFSEFPGCDLRQLNDIRLPEHPDSVICVMSTRNERLRLRHFLDHHRALGVEAFIIADNASDDGTTDFLVEQPDVLLFYTDESYAKLRRTWLQVLLDRFASHRWSLLVDADELLILPEEAQNDIHRFCKAVSQEAADTVIGTMIDMYSDRPLSDTFPSDDRPLYDTCPFFDPGPYIDWHNPEPKPRMFYAGARQRVFWSDWGNGNDEWILHQHGLPREKRGWRRHPERWKRSLDKRISFLARWSTSREVWTQPPWRHVTPPRVAAAVLRRWQVGRKYDSRHYDMNAQVSACLLGILHFKLLSDFATNVERAAAEEQHYAQSIVYKVCAAGLRDNPDPNFWYPDARRFEGPRTLESEGLMYVPRAFREALRTGGSGTASGGHDVGPFVEPRATSRTSKTRTDTPTSEYDRKFFDRRRERTAMSARALVPMLHNLFAPRSVLDVGCGDGIWLAEFRRHGVEDVLGVDGPWVERDCLQIPHEVFLAIDLSNELRLGRRFDLAITLEVAEHLPGQAARAFVRSLCEHAPRVVFSAAVPGQGGAGHKNEQWPEYWAAHFKSFGYQCFDVIRPRIWADRRIADFYKQNTVLFAHNSLSWDCEALKRQEKELRRPLNIVHPALFERIAGRKTKIK